MVFMKQIILLIFLIIGLTGCSDSKDIIIPAEGNVEYEGEIEATIFVESMPAEIIVDYASFSESSQLYYWSLSFDVNGDGIVNDGDILLLLDYIHSGRDERVVNLINLEAQLYQYVGVNGLSPLLPGGIEFETSEDSITFIVQKSWLSHLAEITPETQFVAGVYMTSSTGRSSDYLPGPDMYTQVQDTQSVADDLSDFNGLDSSVDISRVEVEFIE